jgi:hypothetical protein
VFKSLYAHRSARHRVATQDEEIQGSRDFAAHGRLAWAMLVESDRVVLPKIVTANSSWLAEFYRYEIIERGLELFISLLERGMAQGEFRRLPAAHVARLCVAPVLLGAIWRVTFAHLDSEPYDYKGLVETHLDILFRGLAPEGAAP